LAFAVVVIVVVAAATAAAAATATTHPLLTVSHDFPVRQLLLLDVIQRKSNQTNVMTCEPIPVSHVHAETCAPVIRDGYSNPKAAVFSPQRCQPLVRCIVQAFKKRCTQPMKAFNPYPATS
jgi:hypothetical protein